MRRYVEIDLPTRFAKEHASLIEGFLADAIPGMALNLQVVPGFSAPPALASAFVSSSSFERNIITLRTVDLSGTSGPVMLLEPADAHSRRLIDKEEARLKAEEPPPASRHVGGSRPLQTGYPVTGTFGW
jgi:hypothetical protein